MHVFAIEIFKKKKIMTLIRDTLNCVAENNRVDTETLSKEYNTNSCFLKNHYEFVLSGKYYIHFLNVLHRFS